MSDFSEFTKQLCDIMKEASDTFYIGVSISASDKAIDYYQKEIKELSEKIKHLEKEGLIVDKKDYYKAGYLEGRYDSLVDILEMGLGKKDKKCND